MAKCPPQGPKGDRGPAGPQGERGERGFRGPEGPQGERGPKGDRGEKGERGPEGKQGPKGDRGEKGDKGDQGQRGPEGKQGIQGPRGWMGRTGPKGDKGDKGDRGPRGLPGARGPAGRQGPAGKDGNGGITIPIIITKIVPTLKVELKPQIALEVALQVKAYFEANLSVIANFIYAKLEANLFVRLQASVEVWLQNNINLFVALIYAKLEANLYLRLEPNIKIYIDNNPKFRGPDGAKGEKGDKGDRGERGLQGLPGQDGAKGEKGDRGDRGERGERGLPGLKGDKGEKGDKGDRGERGLPGKDGLTDLTFTPRLFWNPNNNRLELRLTINGTTKTTTVTIPMECDFSELIEYLQDIQDKVTITPDIQAGECGDPSEPGDWYQYIPGTAVPAGGLEEAFTLLSNQIKELHETACQGVQPKVPVRDLPQVIECVKDEETGDVQVQAMSLGDMETNLGFVPPWAIGVAKDVIAPWAIDQALNWLGNWLTEQTKINQEIICKIEAGGDCSVLLPDPSAVWNTKGSYLLFYWYLEGQPNWKHTTQLAEPIDAITNPGDPASVWATYFAGLEIKIGNQWAQIYTADKRRRSPLYRGWFWDKQEAEDKLYQIAALSKIPIREFNNPKFTEVKNQTVHLTNQGKIMKLRKVCVAVKTEDSDQITIVRGYERPQEN